jgi:hypothetical protein
VQPLRAALEPLDLTRILAQGYGVRKWIARALRASRAAATESPVRQRRAQLGREQPDAVPGEHSSADTFSGYGIYLEHSTTVVAWAIDVPSQDAGLPGCPAV